MSTETTEAPKQEPVKETPAEEIPLTDYQLAVQQANLARSMDWIDEPTFKERLAEAASKMTDEEKAEFEKERKAEEAAKAKELAEKEKEEETDEEKEAAEVKAKEKAEAKSKADAEAKAKAEAEKKAADERERESKRVERETVDDEAVHRAAELAAQKVLDQTKPKTDPAPDTFESSLPKAYRKDLAVARFIAQSDPKQANLPNQFLQAYKTEGEYIAKWEAEHPGDEFDADADEHKQFYARTFPKIDEEEFDAAKEAMLEAQITQKVEAKIQERIKPKVDRVETVEKLRETREEVEQKAHNAVAELLAYEENGKPLFPEIHEQIVKDGKKVLTDEVGKKVQEQDPVAFDILDAEAGRVRFLTAELHRLADLGEPYRKLTAEKAAEQNKQAALAHMAHRELNDFAVELEDRLRGQKDEHNRSFLTQDEFNKKAATIVRSTTMNEVQKDAAIRDLSKRHFILTADVIERELIKDAATKSAQTINRLKGYVAKLTNGKPPPASKKDADETPSESEETTPEPKQHKPPTTASASDKTNTGKKGGVQGALTWEQVEKSAWS